MSFLYFLPIVLQGALSFFPNKTWIWQMPPSTSLGIAIGVLVFSFVSARLFKDFKLNGSFSFHRILILSIVWSFMLFFPLRDLRFGDGILLLETNYLETKLFGFQTTLDEMGEAGIHSLTYQFLSKIWNTELTLLSSFALVSWIAGLGYLLFIGFVIRSESLLQWMILLSSQGMLVFFGYAENYSLVSLGLVLTFYYFHQIAKKEILETKDLVFGTIFTVFCMYLHLVAGHLVFVLIYLWWQLDRKEKTKALLLCSSIGLTLLISPMLYFLYIHDPGIDLFSTHLAHPPLYPLQRMISSAHVWEVLQLLLFNSFFAFWFLVFLFFQKDETFQEKWKKRETQVYWIGFLSFLFHAFRHNPMLGYPADWDLMGFFWIPLTLLAHSLASPQSLRNAKNLLIFSLLILFFHSVYLSKETQNTKNLLFTAKQVIDGFVEKELEAIEHVPKREKKFVSKMDYFFFRNLTYLKASCPSSDRDQIIASLEALESRWKREYRLGILQNKPELQSFLNDATLLNTTALKFLEADTRCRL